MRRIMAFFLSVVVCIGVFNYSVCASDSTLFETDFESSPPTLIGANADSAQIASDNYIKMVDNSWAATGYEFPAHTSGALKVTFDFNFEDFTGHQYFMLHPETKAHADTGFVILTKGNNGKMHFAAETSDVIYPIGQIVEDEWYTYSAEFNLDTAYCEVEITKKRDGSSIGSFAGNVQRKNVISGDNSSAYRGMLAAGSEYSKFSLLGSQKGTYLDNIKITVASGETLLEADFDTATPTLVGANAAAAEVIENKFVKMVDNSWSATGYEFSPQTNANLEISFDFNFEDLTGHQYFMLHPKANAHADTGFVILTKGNNGKMHFAAETSDVIYPLGQIAEDRWYTYKAHIDPNSAYCKIEIFEREDGNLVGNYEGYVQRKNIISTDNQSAYRGILAAGSEYSKFSLLGNQKGTYLDNIKISILNEDISPAAKIFFDGSRNDANIDKQWAVGGNKTLIEKEGVNTLALGGEYPTYYGIDISDNIFSQAEPTTIAVKVKYYDEGLGYLSLSYVDRENAYTVLNPSDRIEMTNSKEWREHTFIIDNAMLCDSSYIHGADLWLATWTEEYKSSAAPVYIRSVEIEKTFPKTPVVVSATSDYVGNVFDESEIKAIDINLNNISDIAFDTDVTYKVLNYDKSPYTESVSISKKVEAKETESINVLLNENLPYGCYYLEVCVKANNGEKIYNSCDLYDFSVADKRGENEPGNPMLRSMFHSARRVAGLEGDKALTLMNWAGLTGLRDEILQSQAEVKSGSSVTIETPYHQKDITFPNLEANNQENNMLILTSDSTIYNGGVRDYPKTAEQIEAYQKYVTEVVQQNEGYFDYYQIWNEPNLDINTSDTSGEAYAELVKLTTPIIREYDPTAKICIFATAQIPHDFLKAAMDEGVLDYADVVTVHPYDWDGLGAGVDMNFRNAYYIERMKELRALIDSYGKTDMPIMMSEVGMRTNPTFASTHLGQAAGLVQIYAMTAGENLAEAIYQYAFLDFSLKEEDSVWGYVNNWYDTVPYSAKPSYVTLAAYNKLLSNAEPTGSIKSGNTSAYKFKNADNMDVIVLWSDHDSDSIALSLGTSEIEIRDMYGNVRANLREADGVYDFHATFEPQYIIGSFSKFEKAEPMITLTGGRADAMTGSEVTMIISDAENRNLTAKVYPSNDVDVISKTDFTNGAATYKFKACGEAGEKEIVFELYDGDKLVYYTKAHVCVHSFCRSITTSSTAKKISVTGIFKNILSETAEGKLIIAQYDKNGALIDCSIQDASLAAEEKGSKTFEVTTVEDVEYYKVFVWKDLDTLLPYCKAEKFLYKEE